MQRSRAFVMIRLAVGAALVAAVAPLAADDAKPASPIRLRVASYNIEFGKSCTPEELGKLLAEHAFDVVALNEAPGGDWAQRAGKAAKLPHVFVGKVSSANHKDKYKAILSRTRLAETDEIVLRGQGWNPASAVRAETKVAGRTIALYSLHISGNVRKDAKGRLSKPGHSHDLAKHIKDKEKAKYAIVMGDFNNRLPDEAMAVLLDTGLKATWADLKIDLAKQFTWNALNPKQNEGVIDHVLYRDGAGMKVVGGGIIELERPLSDHKPVWAEFEIP